MTGGINRLPDSFGRLIDRRRPIAFTFEGRDVTGFAGDTVAAALAANDQWVLSRSFKYRRPRGVLTMAGQDSNTLVQIGAEPNVLADRRAIEPGLGVMAQNYDGSLEADRGQIIELFGRFLPVGFYYKAFFRHGSWKFWEKIIRNRAGLGKVDLSAHHGYFDKQYLFADVAVVGGGSAGLWHGGRAAGRESGGVLIEEWPILGGNLLIPHRARCRLALAETRGQVGQEQYPRSDRCRLHRLVLRQLASDRPGQPPLQAPRQIGGDGDRLPRAAGRLPQQRSSRRHAWHGGPAADPPLWHQARPQGGGAGGQ